MEEHDDGRGKNSSSVGVASTSGSGIETKDMPTVILVIGRELPQSVPGIMFQQSSDNVMHSAHQMKSLISV